MNSSDVEAAVRAVLEEGILSGVRSTTRNILAGGLALRVGLEQAAAGVKCDPDTFGASSDAIRCLFDTLTALSARGAPFAGLVDAIVRDFLGDDVRLHTLLAVHGELRSYLSVQYLDAVAAVLALEAHGCVIDVRHCHGWPILSVVASNTTTVADGEGSATALPRSAADAA